MDPMLAEMYGTGQGNEGYLEKAAAVELLTKIAEEQDVDLSDIDLEDLDEEELEALLEEALGEEGYEEDPEGDPEEIEKESMAKFAEADFLGRVMAHSMNQEKEKIALQEELRNTTKVQRSKRMQLGKAQGLTGRRLKEYIRTGRRNQVAPEVAARSIANIGTAPRLGPEELEAGIKAQKAEQLAAARAGKGSMRGSTGLPFGRKMRSKALEAAMRFRSLSRLGKAGIIGGGAAAVLGAGGYGAYRGLRKKESSAIDALAEQRAVEIAEAYGLQKQSPPVEDVVNQRALEMLIEAGYIDPSDLE